MRVERTSYGKRLLRSFGGLVLGVILFFASFIVLFLNEGRENFAKSAKEAVEYNASEVYNRDQLVFVFGKVDATQYAEDPYLSDNGYIYIKRVVEMYAWVETEHRQEKENIGGSKTTVYTYSYDLKWISTPKQTNTFKGDNTELPTNIPNDYNTWIANMPGNTDARANGLSINGVNISSSSTLQLSGQQNLLLDSSLVKPESLQANESVTSDAIFRKNSEAGSITNPSAGDIRIRYEVVTNSTNGILFGAIDNNSFGPFITGKNNSFYRFFNGVESYNQAVNILQTEYRTSLWMTRLIGFLMMFIGLILFANPIMTLVSVIPIFAKMGRFVYSIFAFLVALSLSTLTIILGIIFNNPIIAVGIILLLIFIVVIVLKRKKAKVVRE